MRWVWAAADGREGVITRAGAFLRHHQALTLVRRWGEGGVLHAERTGDLFFKQLDAGRYDALDAAVPLFRFLYPRPAGRSHADADL
jgi:hypothetical protein